MTDRKKSFSFGGLGIPHDSLINMLGGIDYGRNRQADQTFYWNTPQAGDSLNAARYAAQLNARAQQDQAAFYAYYQSYIARQGQGWLTDGIVDPPIPEHEGIQMGEVYGWRIWRISKTGFLQSAIKDTHWVPGEPMEGDIDEGCRTGINAFKKASWAVDEYGSNDWDKAPRVLGRVAMWGEIVEHEKGYRAQYADPVEFKAVLPHQGRRAESILMRMRMLYRLEKPKE